MASTTLPNNLPTSITAIYDVVSQTLVSKSKKYETEIGDLLTTTDFLPQVKVKRWANDANFSLRFLDAKPATKATVTATGKTITWAKNGYTLTFYDNGFDENGGFEFEIQLAQKPPVNSITFTIQTKNLVYEYQPALTAEEIAAGKVRPDNVVGSYAVYHVSKRDNEYETGKAFHIYRPWAQDSSPIPVRVWCDLVIDAQSGTATLTVPQAFLNSAIYPVIIDPTFGYTSVGASSEVTSAGFVIAYAASAASSGTVTGISWYCDANDSGATVYLGAYNDSAGSPGSKIASGSTIPSAGGWATVTVSASMTSGSKWLAFLPISTDVSYKYDSTTGSRYYRSGQSSMPDPFGTPEGGPYASQLASMYATYDLPVVARRRLTLLGVA